MEVRRIDQLAQTSTLGAYALLTPKERAEQEQLIHAVESVNKGQVFGEESELRFVFDRHSRRPILRVVNKETNEVIQQVPPEYILRLAESLEQ